MTPFLMKKGISIVIPTYNGGKIFVECLNKIKEQKYAGEIQLIVIDSGSSDGTPNLAENAGAIVKRIDNREFNHAKTRNASLAWIKYDNVVFTVQDVIPCSLTWLSDLEDSINQYNVVAVYTDQIPHDDATLYARFENQCIRNFRGQQAVLQGLDSPESFREMPYHDAYKAIALDNICAIYRTKSLMSFPFPEVDFAEDMAWSFAKLLKGEKILYQPSITVRHSHNRTPYYGFRRQITNSYWCAKIMNRIAHDLSSLSLTDLVFLTSNVRELGVSLQTDLLKMGDNPAMNGQQGLRVIEKIVEQYSWIDRARWFFMDQLPNIRKHVSHEFEMIREQTCQHIVQTLELIKTDANAEIEEELMEALEHIIANSLGKIYGEVYASNIIRSRASQKLSSFISHYMQGI
ncbi:glycosyltransferase, group 2 family protein [delta proteobacterium NaphS2]|nr:glycosyltransferase, group 2 family protein [delta proteobacterium NaphS2]